MSPIQSLPLIDTQNFQTNGVIPWRSLGHRRVAFSRRLGNTAYRDRVAPEDRPTTTQRLHRLGHRRPGSTAGGQCSPAARSPHSPAGCTAPATVRSPRDSPSASWMVRLSRIRPHRRRRGGLRRSQSRGKRPRSPTAARARAAVRGRRPPRHARSREQRGQRDLRDEPLDHRATDRGRCSLLRRRNRAFRRLGPATDHSRGCRIGENERQDPGKRCLHRPGSRQRSRLHPGSFHEREHPAVLARFRHLRGRRRRIIGKGGVASVKARPGRASARSARASPPTPMPRSTARAAKASTSRSTLPGGTSASRSSISDATGRSRARVVLFHGRGSWVQIPKTACRTGDVLANFNKLNPGGDFTEVYVESRDTATNVTSSQFLIGAIRSCAVGSADCVAPGAVPANNCP